MESTGPVIAAVDLSEISPVVVRASVGLARRLGAPLLVLHCSEALTDELEAAPLLPGLRHLMARTRTNVERQLLSLLREVEAGLDLPLEVAVVPGAAMEVVAERAADRDALLVVLGAPHPHRVLDSTVEKLVRRCRAPVLIVRHPPVAGYQRVLVGVDFSAASRRAWTSAVSLAEGTADFVACRVLEGHESAGEAKSRLQTWASERATGLAVRTRVDSGTPRAALLSAVEREGTELLALGRPSHLGLTELFLGSVAERLAATAPCDVLVAGAADPDEQT